MQITIRFDKDSSKWVDENFEFNRLFIKAQHEYIKDLCKHQGYIYILIRYMNFWGLAGIHMTKMCAGYLSEMVNLKFLLPRTILVEKFGLIFSQIIKTEPLTTALFFLS